MEGLKDCKENVRTAVAAGVRALKDVNCIRVRVDPCGDAQGSYISILMIMTSIWLQNWESLHKAFKSFIRQDSYRYYMVIPKLLDMLKWSQFSKIHNKYWEDICVDIILFVSNIHSFVRIFFLYEMLHSDRQTQQTKFLQNNQIWRCFCLICTSLCFTLSSPSYVI